MAYSEKLQGEWRVIEEKCSGDETLWGGYQRVMRKDGFKCWRTIIRYNQMTECQIQAVRSEFGTLMSIRHPNLSDHYSWAHDRQNREIYMMREDDRLNTLENYIGSCRNHRITIPEKVIWEIAVQVFEGLFACHYLQHTPSANSWNANGPEFCPILPMIPTSHGDVRPANVHWEPGKALKLTRFRMHTVVELMMANGRRGGSQAYTAPEVLNGGRHSPASDIWSVGCLLSELCTLNPVFSSRQTQQDIVQGLQGGLIWVDSIECSTLLKQVIKACLQFDPAQRPTTAQILGNGQVLAIRQNLTNSNGRMEAEAQNAQLQALLEKQHIESVALERVYTDEVAFLKTELNKKEREIQRLREDKVRMRDELPQKISEAIAGMDLASLVVNGLSKGLGGVFDTQNPVGGNGGSFASRNSGENPNAQNGINQRLDKIRRVIQKWIGSQNRGAAGMRKKYGASDVEMGGISGETSEDLEKTFLIVTEGGETQKGKERSSEAQKDGGGVTKGKGKAVEADKKDGGEGSKGKGKGKVAEAQEGGGSKAPGGKVAEANKTVASQTAARESKETVTTQSSATGQHEQSEEGSSTEPDEFEEGEEETEAEEEEEEEGKIKEGADSDDPDA